MFGFFYGACLRERARDRPFVSLHKSQVTFCVWPLIQRSDLGCGLNPPGRVLQGAADFAHLLLPKIHHCQMDPAVLTHTDFPVCINKHSVERANMDESILGPRRGDYRKEERSDQIRDFEKRRPWFRSCILSSAKRSSRKTTLLID